MKNAAFWAVLGLAALLAQCKNSSAGTAAAPAEPIVFTQQKTDWKGCLTPKDTGRCAEVKVDYPLATGGGKNATDAINRAVEAFVIRAIWLSDAPPPAVATEAATAFVQAFREAAKDGSSGPMGWSANITGKPIFQSGKVVSLELAQDSYTGGAHGNASALVASFDALTGRQLTKADLLADTASIMPKLEAEFKKAKGLAEADDIKNVIFPDVRFGLPQNMAVVKEGIRFFYNPYEVGPWAIGSTDFTLSWEALGRAADKNKFH